MKSAEYWRKRSEEIAQDQYRKTDDFTDKHLRQYDLTLLKIQQDIDAFYTRFALNNDTDLASARRLLTGRELNEFKMTLEEFTALAKDNADGRWTQILNNVYYKTRVSRLESLMIQVRQRVEMLKAGEQQGVRDLLGDVYEDTYYRNVFELQRGTGFGVTFAKLNEEGIDKALSTEWKGSNYSKRIWGDRDKLVDELRTKITQSFIRGDSSAQMIKDVSERMHVSRSNAKRLIETESSFITHQATAAGYSASGIVKQYEILATLDMRTSDICRDMDGKVFRLSEEEVSVTYPPFHAHCRTTVMPYFDDEIDAGERIARDETGQTYFVPGDLTYERWYNERVKPQNNPTFLSNVQNIYNSWDKQDVTGFAQNVLDEAGSRLKVQRHKISAHGQCVLDPSEENLQVNTYELNSTDARSIEYQVKTAFHELFHARAHGLPHDINEVGFDEWAYYDDVFAESFAHFMVKQIGITDEISPSYAGYLIETLPKLKSLPTFKQASKISDFGEIAYQYRFGEKPTAAWENLIKEISSKDFDISDYSQSYLGYMKENTGELVDKMLDNMPDYKEYRAQMLGDVDSAITKGAKGLTGNEKIVFENVLMIAMNRLGVNEL